VRVAEGVDDAQSAFGISARPRSRGYRSGQVFRFTERADAAVFHEAMARLLGDDEVGD